MKGIRLDALSQTLHKVGKRNARNPAVLIMDAETKLGPWKQKIEEYGYDPTFQKYYHWLPLEAFRGFSFEELCCLFYSKNSLMHDSVEKLFESNPQHEVVRKIINSFWQWGAGRGTWNELVEAYENIRYFHAFDGPDFELRIDHATWHNPYGYAKYSRIYLDGIFAFLVYYKKQHVMTIGFSVMEGHELLIQQVQLATSHGNRWLYKLPSNRLEFVIGLFQKNFLGYGLWLVDGESLLKKTLADYQRGLELSNNTLIRYRNSSERVPEEDREFVKKMLVKAQNDKDAFEAKIAHLESNRRRLVNFYHDAGVFKPTQSEIFNNILHHKLELNVAENNLQIAS